MQVFGIICAILWVLMVGWFVYNEITNWAQHWFGRHRHWFKNAEFVEVLHGDRINIHDCRSIWKIKHWPFYIKSDETFEGRYLEP